VSLAQAYDERAGGENENLGALVFSYSKCGVMLALSPLEGAVAEFGTQNFEVFFSFVI